MKYSRILLKISGESLAGDRRYGIDKATVAQFASEVASVMKEGVQVGIVIGGGNIHRGHDAEKGMDRTTSDHMGMLATVINSLALQYALEKQGVSARVMTAIAMREIAESYVQKRAIVHLQKNRAVIFAAGTGRPYFTTDTAAALRANEIGADIILKATKVDGIYDKDPMCHGDAKKFDQLRYIDVLNKNIKVVDSTAITLCMDNGLSIIVLNIFKTGSILECVRGGQIGTIVGQ